MEVNQLIPIGEKIKVDKSKIENLLPNKLLEDQIMFRMFSFFKLSQDSCRDLPKANWINN